MKSNLLSFFVGLLFALGLGISGMTQPQKIFGFLDIFGNWNPALLFVMVGAISFHFVFYQIVKKRSSSLLADKWHLSTKTKITPSLIVGAFIFGLGWGLGGYCPGPALVSLASLQDRPFIFVVSMILGMWIFKLADKRFKFNR